MDALLPGATPAPLPTTAIPVKPPGALIDLLDAARAGAALSAIEVLRLGECDYASTRTAMQQFTAARTPHSVDQIWLVSHPPVYTLGQAGRIEHLRDQTTPIAVHQVERGGQITYHGPGQVVAYTLIDLRRRGIKVREFVALLEGAVIDTLAAYDCKAERKPGAPGIYVAWQGQLAKIAALGLKIQHGASFHGLALNVDMDLRPFSAIDPCGFAGLTTVDLATLGTVVPPAQVAERLALRLVARIEQKDWS